MSPFSPGETIYWTTQEGDLFAGTVAATAYPAASHIRVDEEWLVPVEWAARTRDEAVAKRVAWFEERIKRLRQA
jgi:hypothetical protein